VGSPITPSATVTGGSSKAGTAWGRLSRAVAIGTTLHLSHETNLDKTAWCSGLGRNLHPIGFPRLLA
jgi:hypothetical protein